jgi:hypothetical protein
VYWTIVAGTPCQIRPQMSNSTMLVPQDTVRLVPLVFRSKCNDEVSR